MIGGTRTLRDPVLEPEERTGGQMVPVLPSSALCVKRTGFFVFKQRIDAQFLEKAEMSCLKTSHYSSQGIVKSFSC